MLFNPALNCHMLTPLMPSNRPLQSTCHEPAEASCVSAIAAARDFVSDVGERAALRSGGLVQVARCSEKNPERDCQRLLINRFGLALKVRKTHLGSLEHIPVLKIQDWFQFFLMHGCIHVLHGLQKPHPAREESILAAFWDRFRSVHPQHAVFREAAEGRVVLRRALPLVLHGDEGRGRKHAAHFVLSFHSLLGRGFGKADGKRHWIKMECNFKGHSYCSRYLIASLRKKDYSEEQSGVWRTLMHEVAEDAASMWQTGISNRDGLAYFGIVLGLIGDWPFLHKAGVFTRSFNNAQKRATVRNPCRGICHLCKAGQPQYDFEQLATRRPEWLGTEHVESPFETPSPFAANLLHEPGKEASLFFFDWFHTMHLGVLKNYLASVLALLSEEEQASNREDRFASLTLDFKQWCQQNRRRAGIAKISKECLGWDTTAQYPSGTWHKGSLSTVLMEYVEARFKAQSFNHEPLLALAAEACEAIQECSRTLYRSGVWLDPQQCGYVAGLGLRFLRRYASMATLSKTSGRCLFVLQPKVHCLHHFLIKLWSAHENNQHGMNPLATSCQQSEDFIGRPSRLSRRVTAQLPVLHRVMDRYLESAYHHFVQAGYLIRSEG